MSLLNKSLRWSVIAVLSAGIVGCESKAGTGALVGGAGGAAAGGLIGSMSHARAGEGALIGGAIGAIGGGLIGHGMDENDKKEARKRRDYNDDYDRRYNASSSQWRQGSAVSKSDVIAWTDQGVRDDIIVDRIDRSGAVFHLSAKDQNELRDRGVSENVIQTMKDTARR